MAIQFTQAKQPLVNADSTPLVNTVANALPSPAPLSDSEGVVSSVSTRTYKGKRKRKTYADGHAIDTRQAYMREYMRKRRLSTIPNAP